MSWDRNDGITERIRKARRARRCYGCKQLIEPGQTYRIEDYLPWHYPECPKQKATFSHAWQLQKHKKCSYCGSIYTDTEGHLHL